VIKLYGVYYLETAYIDKVNINGTSVCSTKELMVGRAFY